MVRRKSLLVLIILILTSACVKPQTSMNELWIPAPAAAGEEPIVVVSSEPTSTPYTPPIRPSNATIPSPTPDSPHKVPPVRTQTERYTIQAGDTLAIIARRFGVDAGLISETNKITNPNMLKVGQVLVIPPPQANSGAPSFKIIPDSEFIYGPYTVGFNVKKFVELKNGYLDNYREEVDGELITGAQIVEKVSREHSVNPRLLLAVLEYTGGWVTQSDPPDQRLVYPLGFFDRNRRGLYKQLFWAANNLNRGFYTWMDDSLSGFSLADGSYAAASPLINSGTAAIQYLMGLLLERSSWLKAVGENGVYAKFNQFFGYPFDFTFEPLIPKNLRQPDLQLPFENDVMWYFTGGPHMGWDDGSASAALDFAPFDAGSCNVSQIWAVAVANGVIARSGNGSVILDLDGDGNEQTGWSILYLHIATSGRIQAGKKVKAGDRIGHPSCEGGFSIATHLHIARRYNGVWIPAGDDPAFTMDGWKAISVGVEYDGYLKRNGQSIMAWNGRANGNQIQR